MLTPFKPLPYQTIDELFNAWKSGVKFNFIRKSREQEQPVVQMRLAPKRLLVLDKDSLNGHAFNSFGQAVMSNGMALESPYLVLADQAVLVASAPKATFAGLCKSDIPGVEAAAKLAVTPTPAPSFMVAQPKSADGLLTVYNPDNRHTLIRSLTN